ncbi:MAG: sulfurtransferase, partial [Hyphomicrobiaceae bacterium]
MLRNSILPLAAATTICLGALGAHANPPTYANPQLRTTAVQLRDAVEHQRALGWFDATTPIRVVDVRSAKAFAAGHLPGAINLPTNELADPMAHVPGALKSDRRIAQLLGLLGINSRTAVVIYDDKGGFHAARLFWLLEYYGHRKVSLLDGGIQAWKAAGFRLIGSRSQAPHRKAVF